MVNSVSAACVGALLGRRQSVNSDFTITVYSRRGCPACEDMIAELEFAPLSQALPMAVIDVDTDPKLAQKYGWDVPVLMLNDHEVCRHSLDLEKLRSCLAEQG